MPLNDETPQLSLVIPVYNGAGSIGPLVDRIHDLYRDTTFEIVLVNDGSQDNSEGACAALVERYPQTVTFVHLARNFGEHNAVLAGLNHCRGAHAGVLDDDGQNPPEELRRMLDHLRSHGHEVVYGRYRVKRHHLLRNLGSWFNDRMANLMLKKPRGLYLSSFKVMTRFVVDEITKYRGAFPYIDGLIFRTTRNIGQIDVEHRNRDQGRSNYTIKKLVKLWMNMFLSYSILPLRISVVAGVLTSLIALVLIIEIVIEKLWVNPNLPLGVPSILIAILFFAGVQLIILGTIGEYLGRLFLDHSGNPQFVVRYVRRGDREDA